MHVEHTVASLLALSASAGMAQRVEQEAGPLPGVQTWIVPPKEQTIQTLELTKFQIQVFKHILDSQLFFSIPLSNSYFTLLYFMQYLHIKIYTLVSNIPDIWEAEAGQSLLEFQKNINKSHTTHLSGRRAIWIGRFIGCNWIHWTPILQRQLQVQRVMSVHISYL